MWGKYRCIHADTETWICTCGGQRSRASVFFRHSSLSLYWTWNSPVRWTIWPMSSILLYWPPLHRGPEACNHIWHFMWVLWIQTQIPKFVKQALYHQNYFSGPTLQYLKKKKSMCVVGWMKCPQHFWMFDYLISVGVYWRSLGRFVLGGEVWHWGLVLRFRMPYAISSLFPLFLVWGLRCEFSAVAPATCHLCSAIMDLNLLEPSAEDKLFLKFSCSW